MLAIARGTNTAQQLAELLSMRSADIQSMLAHMIKNKLLIRTGSGHATKFALTETGKQEVTRLKARRP